MQDFPAAHSMDTMWFAVDSDGHVAVFETGESGCVPVEAYLGDDGNEIPAVLEALPETGAIYDLAGQRAAAGRDHIHREHLVTDSEVLVFVSELAPFRDLLDSLGVAVVTATAGAALKLNTSEPTVFDELHARNACLGCFYLSFGERPDLAARGVYLYDHIHVGLAGPYARTTAPKQPITREALARFDKVAHFKGRFADTPQLQPAELWPCESWEPGWVASDGKTVRAFPGREKDYRETAAQYGAFEPNLVFVDAAPASAARSAAPAEAKLLSPRKPWWKFW